MNYRLKDIIRLMLSILYLIFTIVTIESVPYILFGMNNFDFASASNHEVKMYFVVTFGYIAFKIALGIFVFLDAIKLWDKMNGQDEEDF